MDELSQEDKFRELFDDLIKDETVFSAKWDNQIIFTHPKVMPTIANKNLLTPKAKDKLQSLFTKYIGKRL